MALYRIRDWAKHFEKADTRKCSQTKWVPFPNKWDGKSYKRIMRLKDGMTVFAAWVLIVQVASRCPVRGVLSDDDGPLTATDIADKTSSKTDVIERAIEVLCSKEIGWIQADSHPEVSGCHPEDAGNFRGSPEVAGLQDRTGQDITEQRTPTEFSTETPVVALVPVLVFPCKGEGKQEWVLTQTKVDEYTESFPGVDVMAECRKARQWCIDNPQKRKTPGGMLKYLSGWLSRVQDRGGNGISGKNHQRSADASRVQSNGPSLYDGLV